MKRKGAVKGKIDTVSYSNRLRDSHHQGEPNKLPKLLQVNKEDIIIEYIKMKSHSIPLIVTRSNKIVKMRSQSYPSSPMDLDPDHVWF